MSTAPNASTAAATSWSAASALVRSPAWTAVSPSISPAACSATSASRSLIRTLAPSLANSSAVARPIPRADPVTIAAFPSRSPISVRLSFQFVKSAREATWIRPRLVDRPVGPEAASAHADCRRPVRDHLRRSLQGGDQVQPLPYPVQFSVDYPDRDLNRLTTF